MSVMSRTKVHTCDRVTRFTIGAMTLDHEMSDKDWGFAHRLVLPGLVENPDWVGYNQFARVEVRSGIYFACMDSWHGMFPEVYQLVAGKPGARVAP